MSPQITVIITTRDRPEMLAYALRSVRRQTALRSVAMVLVSENGEVGGSEEVCQEFGDLPLRYVRQQPPVSSTMHLNAIWHHIETPVVAILHDDDWWLPNHLEDSLAALESHPECRVTFSNFFDCLTGPKTVPWASEKGWRVWISSGADFSAELLMLDKVSVLLACLLHSTFHYSTMVGQKEVIWQAYLQMVEVGNAWDNERVFPVLLSAAGPIGYLTRHAAGIRTHEKQEGLEEHLAAAGFGATRVRTTLWLADREPETTALAVRKFNDTIRGIAVGFHQLLSNQIDEPQKSTLIQRLGIDLIPSPAKDRRWLLRQMFPPAFFAVRRKLKQTLKKRFAKP